MVVNSPSLTTHMSQLVALAAKRRLVAIYEYRIWAERGGLMTYGPVQSEFLDRVAECVDTRSRIRALR